MIRLLKLIFLLFFCSNLLAQQATIDLNKNWQFTNANITQWYKATVPGTVHTDLLANKLIPNPFFGDNEKRLQWIDTCDWIYKTTFVINKKYLIGNSAEIIFFGLDTYADVYLNDKLLLKANNMFRGWNVDVKPFLKTGKNNLKIYFHSAKNIVDSIAKATLPLVLPDNNRVYARKAQFQFGWDWGPIFIGCGIWKKIQLHFYEADKIDIQINYEPIMAKLIQQKDSIGESFYFEKNGKPFYVKGANWIPANIFLPSVKKRDYLNLLLKAKNANMNMLRVWGGGVYEDDYFYDLCDSLGIIVWQDFMFANGMYPADSKYLANVKAEVIYQIKRLKKHPCIVLWCGNNEIDEAWHNWGWQNQFNLHGADSARVWDNYKMLFEDSLKSWVNEFDGRRPYVSSSPKLGWGNKKSLMEGDSHYWGLWWGMEDWETFKTHTGRFVSEYGMQAMSNVETIKTYVPANDLKYNSSAVQWHQKASNGFYKLNVYLDKYFIDSSKLSKLSLQEYSYLTQCLQYYILKNCIAVQRNKMPYNMGTLLWQLNDCWPATSWSITDFSQASKAAWYAVRENYRDDLISVNDTVYPKKLLLLKPGFTILPEGDNTFSIQSNVDAKYVYINVGKGSEDISDNYFDLKAGKKKILSFSDRYFSPASAKSMKITSLYDVLSK